MDTLEHFRRRMGAQGEEAESAAEAPRAYETALSQPSHIAGVASRGGVRYPQTLWKGEWL